MLVSLVALGGPAGPASARARAQHRGATAALDVLPYPGTPDASPTTEINFPTLATEDLQAVTVRGSRSGAHRGALIALAGGGSAFLPARPFIPGERVSVLATLGSPAAGSSAGAPGARRIAFSFTVAYPAQGSIGSRAAATAAAVASRGGLSAAGLGHWSPGPTSFTQSFHSEPALHPPVVITQGVDPDYRSGDMFLDAQRTIQPGPMILGPSGKLIWFAPLSNDVSAADLSVQQYQGQSVLTYWQGRIADGWGQGDDVILNHSYRTIATVHAADGYQADLHEFQITPQGTALITAYAPVQHVDLSSVGGPKDGTLLDSIIQEINIRTGQLIWEWHAYGHVHLAESYAGRPNPNGNPYDFFHINSIQQLPNGDYLVAARHTWAVYEIDPRTGRIPWVLGGKHSSFRVGPGANFEWQHDARMQPNGTITLFDDADGYYRSESQSRGLQISLNFKTMTAGLVGSYGHVPPVLSDSQGNLQTLPNGDVFVGYGANPYFAEFSPSGQQLFSARLASPLEFYRAYRFPWSGYPTTPPSIAVAPAGSGTTVWASWDGASPIAAWRVLAGPSRSSLRTVAQRPWADFETQISTASAAAYFQVQALSWSGRVLRSSAIVAR